jgi:hypothetical protein
MSAAAKKKETIAAPVNQDPLSTQKKPRGNPLPRGFQ